ncbi:hypothetical protein DL96DRAFT_1580210 [Flagelloscypha sp. PMI_526]|nr:hypothetical protein DL96DRAFT_1580210 [Flagelloscypha sp. PMI_526]
MAGFLRDLNLACQFAFGPSFEYSIQIRHECHTPTKGRSDIIITLEHTFKNQIPEYQSETGQVPWSSARRFSARLLDTTNAAITLTTDFNAGVHVDATARQKAQDEMLKRGTRSQMVGMIDPLAFVTHPNEKVLGKSAIDNVNHIIPQLMRYTVEFRCPWITLSDYLHFLTFLIDPDSTSAELADASGMEFTRDTDKEIIPIVLHEVLFDPRDRIQTDRKPRMEIFVAILQRLKDAGFVQEAPLTLVRTLRPLLAVGAANPTFGALVDPSGGNDPDLNEDEDEVIDALDERRRSGKKRHIDSDEESQDEDAWKKRRGEKEEKSDDDDELEDEDDDE